jgi:hypothetical protein
VGQVISPVRTDSLFNHTGRPPFSSFTTGPARENLFSFPAHFPVRDAYGIAAGTSFESVLFPAELTAVTT